MDNLEDLPLVSREWKTGSNSSYNCTPFLHSQHESSKGSSPFQPGPTCLNLNNDQKDLNPENKVKNTT